MPARKRVRRNERERGQGSLKDLPDGRVRAWKPPQGGKRPSRLFGPPDARAKAEAWLRGIEAGPSMPLGQWCELWYTRREPTLGRMSRVRYQSWLGYLAPYHARPLAAITHDDWQDLINQLLRRYARSTLDRARAIWSGAITAAVRAGHIRENTLLGTRLGRADEKIPRAWRLDEQRRLLREASGEPHEAWLHCGLATGMRFEELRTLLVDDIDFVRLTVLVRQSKTGRGRLIPLAPEAAAVLSARVKRLQPGARLALGYPDGQPYGAATLRRWLRALCVRAGVTVLPPHSMRHSYSSNAIADGVDLPALAHDLGHRDIGVTSRVYTHYITQRERPTARAVSRQLYGASAGPKSVKRRGASSGG
jgi:integrase